MNAEKWESVLREKSVVACDYAVVPFAWCREVADGAGVSWREMEIFALEHGLCPSRYERSVVAREIDQPLSAEQIKVLNRMLDGGENGFLQGISASQYQKVAKVSKATATRHLADLLEKRILEKCLEAAEILVIRSRSHRKPHIAFRSW